MASVKDYAIGDFFEHDHDTYEVSGFGTVQGQAVLFATCIAGGPPTDTNDFYAFGDADLPPNIANRPVLQKMTKMELIELFLAKA